MRVFWNFVAVLLALFLTESVQVLAEDSSNSIPLTLGAFTPAKLNPIDLKGWDYLHDLLVQNGVEEKQLEEIFSDPRMPPNSDLIFNLNPKEPYSLYRKRIAEKEVKNAISYYNQHWEIFTESRHQFHIPECILLAILQLETYCGQHTGKEIIFYRLARLASAASPENIEINYSTKSQLDPKLELEKVIERAKWLEQTFLPHTKALLLLAKNLNLHPLELKGSNSGALGIPQFLPEHYLNYGIDGDKDGKINPFSPADAILSTANYLKSNGWKPDKMTQTEKLKVIWTYNRSKPYGETVLALAQKIQTRLIQKWKNSHKSVPNSQKP